MATAQPLPVWCHRARSRDRAKLNVPSTCAGGQKQKSCSTHRTPHRWSTRIQRTCCSHGFVGNQPCAPTVWGVCVFPFVIVMMPCPPALPRPSSVPTAAAAADAAAASPSLLPLLLLLRRWLRLHDSLAIHLDNCNNRGRERSSPKPFRTLPHTPFKLAPLVLANFNAVWGRMSPDPRSPLPNPPSPSNRHATPPIEQSNADMNCSWVVCPHEVGPMWEPRRSDDVPTGPPLALPPPLLRRLRLAVGSRRPQLFASQICRSPGRRSDHQ